MEGPQTAWYVDAGLAVAAALAVAGVWTLTVRYFVHTLAREVGRALATHSNEPLKPGVKALLATGALASLGGPPLLTWLAWTHRLWLTTSTQLALPVALFACIYVAARLRH